MHDAYLIRIHFEVSNPNMDKLSSYENVLVGGDDPYLEVISMT